jgi:hypothetical protein
MQGNRAIFSLERPTLSQNTDFSIASSLNHVSFLADNIMIFSVATDRIFTGVIS